MIDWFKRKSKDENGTLMRAFSVDGVLIVGATSTLTEDVARTAKPLLGKETDTFLHQLEDDGYALPQKYGYSISWDAIYDLIGHPEYTSSLSLLDVPSVSACCPALESRDALTDRTFSISIAGWYDDGGRRIGPIPHTGALIHEAPAARGLAAREQCQRIS
jgi:hypothetical protein